MMTRYPDKNVNVLSGHVHEEYFIRASRNVTCQVGAANQLEAPHSQIIYL